MLGMEIAIIRDSWRRAVDRAKGYLDHRETKVFEARKDRLVQRVRKVYRETLDPKELEVLKGIKDPQVLKAYEVIVGQMEDSARSSTGTSRD